MLIEAGRVVAIDADIAWVETLRRSTCGECAARRGCGHGLLNASLPGASRGLIRARLPERLRGELQLHDTVELALPERSLLRAASLLYLLPLTTALGAALLANRFAVAEGVAQGRIDMVVAIAAALGLGSGLLLLRVVSHRTAGDPAFVPEVTARR